MLSNSSKATRGNGCNSSKGKRDPAGAPGAGEPQHATVAPRATRTSARVLEQPEPAPLARELKQLEQHVRQTRCVEISLAALTALMEALHESQENIRTALRDHPDQAPVPGLCAALLDFARALDKALVGKAGRPDRRVAGNPARDTLPLIGLDIADVRTFCLGVSALANPGGRPPFPADKTAQARDLLSSLCAKLIGQALALGRTEDFGMGPLLDMVNLIRRLVTAELVDPHDEVQADARTFCVQAFAAFQIWAEKERKFDTPHDVSKCASVLEMMYDHDLGGVTDRDNAAALVNVLVWLLGKDAMARIRAEDSAVALAGLANLVKRLLERDKISVLDRKLDPMWRRLLGALLSLAAARMIDKDGRPLGAFSNLLRTMLEKKLLRQWATAARSKAASAREQAALRKLQRQFAQAHAHVVSAMSNAAFKQVRELPILANSVSELKAVDKLRKSGFAPEAWPDRASLVQAAELLVVALSQEALADLKEQKTVGGLFAGLGYLWQEGLVEDKARVLSCLLEVFAALPHTGRWEARHALSVRPVLAGLLAQDHIDMPRLCAVLDVMLGPAAQAWTRAGFLEFARQKTVLADVQPEPLPLDEAQQGEDEPAPVRRLVGESRLVERQEPASAPPSTPAAPQLVSISSRPLKVGGGARSRALARRRGAEWTEVLPSSLSSQLAPPSSSEAGTSPLAAARNAQAANTLAGMQGRVAGAGVSAMRSTTTTTTSTSKSTTTTSTTTTSTTTTSTTTTSTGKSTTFTSAFASTSAATGNATPSSRLRVVDPDQIRKEWFRLLTLPHGDPHAALSRMARQHPECLAWMDEHGCDMFWHLVIGGKVQSVEALIALQGEGWQPVLPDKLMAELVRRILAGERNLPAYRVLPRLMPLLPQQQRFRLQLAVVSPPADPPSFLMSALLRANEELPTLGSALSSALGEGNAKRIGELLRQGANLLPQSAVQAMEALVNSGHDDALAVVLGYPVFADVLGWQCREQRSLLHVALDAMVNASGESPEMQSRRKRIFTLLLQSPDLRDVACEPDAGGHDALMLAIMYNRHGEVADMLKHEKFCTALRKIWPDYGTALSHATTNNLPGMLEVLAGTTAARPLYTVAWGGMLPIEHAIQNASPAMVRALLKDKRAWRKVFAENMLSLSARAAARGLWELVPEILQVPSFAQQAGNPGPDRKTLLAHAVLEGKVELLSRLLALRSVRDSVFTLCHLRIDMPAPADSPMAQFVAGASIHRDMDAVMLAVESGDARLLDPLLELDTVRARLRKDAPWKDVLVCLARDEAPHLLSRLQQS